VAEAAISRSEPKEAFPYLPPSDALRRRYEEIFAIDRPLPLRVAKVLFDKAAAGSILLVAVPVLLLIKVAYTIEGWLIPENAGPMFFHYNAMSAGRVIRKYKIPAHQAKVYRRRRRCPRGLARLPGRVDA